MRRSEIQAIYQKRRQKLISTLKKDGDFIILYSAPALKRTADQNHAYRQDPLFYYFTGLEHEQNVIWVAYKEKRKNVSHVFVPEHDPLHELWEGKRLHPKAAQKELDCHYASPLSDFDDFFDEYLLKQKPDTEVCLKSNAWEYPALNASFQKLCNKILYQARRTRPQLKSIENLSPWVNELRSIKDKYEIKEMEKASQINSQAYVKILKKIKNFRYEYEIQASLEEHYKSQGATGPAYASICASGNNATVLHYGKNNQRIQKDELILIDAGCEVNMYCSDITRTVPASGIFTEEQKSIYELVLKAQKEALKGCYPGNTFSKIHQDVVKILSEGLKALGLLKGSLKEILKKESVRKYYPHGLGHWIGLDTHDPCPRFSSATQKEIPFKAGMILTIEPGLYFPKQDKNIPQEYRGIGVRIEDIALITARKKAQLLTKVPKEISEIEKLMN